MHILKAILASAALLTGLAVSNLDAAASDATQVAGPAPPFFPFCIETHDAKKRTIEQQAALVKELGFAGVGHLWLEDVPERLKTLDDAGLKLFWIHTVVNLDPDKRPYDPKLVEVLPLLKNRGVLLSISMVGQRPSDESFDPRAVEILREIADEAAGHDVRVVLYHHLDHWTERFEDCVRVARKVDRPNLGAMFNLCHWSRKGQEQDLRGLLESSMPTLFCVAINGSDRPADLQSGKGQFIQPLDSGTYDVLGLLRMLKELGYHGPIGLMCWGLKGDARDHLARSMTAWRKMQRQLAAP
jgi:sugar phosphate isomerase/epimerase